MNELKSLVANLIGLAKSDGTLDNREVDVVFSMAERLGLSEEEINEIVKDDNAADNLPSEPGDVVKYFYRLLVLAISDGSISEEEKSFLKSLGVKAGIDPERVDKAIQYYRDNGRLDISDGDMDALMN